MAALMDQGGYLFYLLPFKRLIDRGISHADVIAVLAQPEIEQAERLGRRSAWSIIHGRGIKVVYFEHPDGPIIVTAIRHQRRPKPCKDC